MFAQLLLDQILLSACSQGMGKAYFRLLFGLRKIVVRVFGDPIVNYKIGRFRFKLPLSHDLPLFRTLYPQYSTNVARLAAALARKYPNMAIIDIGANVGDTYFLLREAVQSPILCIDGDEKFFRLLSENCDTHDDVVLENSFIGEKDGFVRGSLTTEYGTGRITLDEASGVQVKIARLSAILDRYPQFFHSKLIKLDTDGYDCRIIRSELEMLSVVKPAVFFEYDPTFFEAAGDDGFAVFDELKRCGYDHLLCYDNFGDLLIAPRLSDASVLEDIHRYYRHRGNKRYLDICAFHSDDSDVFREFRESENYFFEHLRAGQ